MENIRVSLQVTFRWWTKPALIAGIIAFEVFGRELPERYIDFVVHRGMRLEIVE